VPGGVPDARGNGRRVPEPLLVEDAHGHDGRAVGDPRQRTAVVDALPDHARDERSVAVLVVGKGIPVDEVVAAGEARADEVGRAPEALGRPVGDAGVENAHGDATPARLARGDQVGPRVGRVDPGGAEEVPLDALPVRTPAASGVVGDEPGGVRDDVRDGVPDVVLRVERPRRLGHRVAGRDRDDGGGRGALVLHDDFAGHVGRRFLGRGAGGRDRGRHGGQ
jgi:hypothetical protein